MSSSMFFGRDGCRLHAAVLDAMPRVGDESLWLVLLHGGGPDHHSLLPLARQLPGRRIALPDIRGYGLSVCRDPACHTWARYVDDLLALLDWLDATDAVLCGTGIGATIALRAMHAHPERMRGAVLISLEDIEDDPGKAAEIAFLDAFAERVRTEGIEAAWAPVLEHMPPVIGAMVREARPRADAASLAAAAAIGRDRSFRGIAELDGIAAPLLIVPGADARHPATLAEQLALRLPLARLASVAMGHELRDAEQFAAVFAPVVADFLDELMR